MDLEEEEAPSEGLRSQSPSERAMSPDRKFDPHSAVSVRPAASASDVDLPDDLAQESCAIVPSTCFRTVESGGDRRRDQGRTGADTGGVVIEGEGVAEVAGTDKTAGGYADVRCENAGAYQRERNQREHQPEHSEQILHALGSRQVRGSNTDRQNAKEHLVKSQWEE